METKTKESKVVMFSNLQETNPHQMYSIFEEYDDYVKAFYCECDNPESWKNMIFAFLKKDFFFMQNLKLGNRENEALALIYRRLKELKLKSLKTAEVVLFFKLLGTSSLMTLYNKPSIVVEAFDVFMKCRKKEIKILSITKVEKEQKDKKMRIEYMNFYYESFSVFRSWRFVEKKSREKFLNRLDFFKQNYAKMDSQGGFLNFPLEKAEIDKMIASDLSLEDEFEKPKEFSKPKSFEERAQMVLKGKKKSSKLNLLAFGVVNVSPLSVNDAYVSVKKNKKNGDSYLGRILTKKGKLYKEEVQVGLMQKTCSKKDISKDLKLISCYQFYVTNERADVDNCIKLFQDQLEEKYKFNDKKIKTLAADMIIVDNKEDVKIVYEIYKKPEGFMISELLRNY